MLNHILEHFLAKCREKDIAIGDNLAKTVIFLMAQEDLDSVMGQDFTKCKIERLASETFAKFVDPLNATVCNIKMKAYRDSCKEFNTDYLKQKFQDNMEIKLRPLSDQVMQFAETIKTTDEMVAKMQVYIIVAYSLGNPSNHVLLKLVRQGLNSVLSKGDLYDYTRKKTCYRLQYLKRLSATVCGIVVFNNYGPTGDKENMRNIFEDLHMAKRNTKDAIEFSIKNISQNIEYGTSAMDEFIKINAIEMKVFAVLPLPQAHRINKFLALFNVYQRYLKELFQFYEKIEYLITLNEEKFMCVVNKINDLLKYRTAIDGELIFPHFVYLSELWIEFILQINNLAEINMILTIYNTFLSEDLQRKYHDVLEEIKSKMSSPIKFSTEARFFELVENATKGACQANILNMSEHLKDYCSLTMTLTNGLLVPSTVQKKLCSNLNLKFGFRTIELAKYAELHFEEYLERLLSTIGLSVDLILLFNLENEILQKKLHSLQQTNGNQSSLSTQTEMVIENDLSVPNRINVTWNAWDYYREVIRLANLKTKTTHTTQTTLTYGRRNAQNQTNNSRRHIQN